MRREPSAVQQAEPSAVQPALRGDRGAIGAEYMGLIVIVGLVLALLSVSAFGRQLTAAITQALCVVFNLGDAAACGNPGEPADPCITSSTTRLGNVEIGLGVSVDGTLGYIIEERSDGTVAVTEVTGIAAGAGLGVGGEVNIGLGDQQVGLGATAGVGIEGTLETGETLVFPDRDSADQYVENLVVDQATGILGPVGGLVDGALDLVGVGDNDVAGEHESTSVEVGLVADAAAGALGGPVGAEVSGSLGAAASVRANADGTVDASFILEGEAAGGLGIPELAAIDLGVEGSAVATVTFGPDGTIGGLQLEVTAATTNDSGVSDAGSPGELLADLANSVADPEDATQQHIVTLDLDVADADVREAVGEFIGSLGPGGATPSDAAALLGDALLDNATVSTRTYELDDGLYGVTVDGRLGLEGTLGATLETVDSDLVAASYFDPVAGRFVPWEACLDGR